MLRERGVRLGKDGECMTRLRRIAYAVVSIAGILIAGGANWRIGGPF
jgi:hypothetical protein